MAKEIVICPACFKPGVKEKGKRVVMVCKELSLSNPTEPPKGDRFPKWQEATPIPWTLPKDSRLREYTCPECKLSVTEYDKR